MEEQKGLDRRRFHIGVIYGLMGLITAAIAGPAAAYLLFPPRAKKSNEWVEAGDVGQLQPMTPEEVVFRKVRVDGWKVTSEKSTAWVVKQTDQQVVAFAPQCTHLGCAYHWDESHKNFLCPCHTSTFDISGKVLTGPAPRPLDRYEAKVDGGRLLLGSIKRSDT
jgi:menaquinol-cytochrome c reductase iron-sulfur subunit